MKHTNTVSGFDAQDILDNAPIGIYTSTPDGRFLAVKLLEKNFHQSEGTRW